MKVDKSKKFELKSMSPEELNYALDWAADEGWNPGKYDQDCFYIADPNGFFIGELWGRPIGCISAVRYSNDYGFIGLFIIEEEFRKQWFGAYLARTALSYLGKRNIGLDGMPDRIESYERIGFKLAYRILRFEGIAQGKITKNLVDANEIPFVDLAKYDTKMFSAERHEFLKCWINQPESSSYCVMKDNTIKGYGVIRKAIDGFKIGPLFADTPEIAETLFIALSSCAPNEKIYIDVPETNKEALALIKRFRMQMSFESVRMYSKKQPSFPVRNVYGITSSELG